MWPNFSPHFRLLLFITKWIPNLMKPKGRTPCALRTREFDAQRYTCAQPRVGSFYSFLLQFFHSPLVYSWDQKIVSNSKQNNNPKRKLLPHNGRRCRVVMQQIMRAIFTRDQRIPCSSCYGLIVIWKQKWEKNHRIPCYWYFFTSMRTNW